MIRMISLSDEEFGWLGSHIRLMGFHLRYDLGLGLVSNRPVMCHTSSVIVLKAYSSDVSRAASQRKSVSSSTLASGLSENLTSDVKACS